jgi:lipopolysaccharide/colanic/teichoic acid biosynthesis glycosyltransferase
MIGYLTHIAAAAGIAGAVKRSIDFSVALACVILFSPIFLILITLVSLDGGSAFYAQTRVGRNGKRFKCWKFRTMVIDADARLKELLQNDPFARTEYETYWKLKNDPRITKVGRFLRRYSIDEIPQLINVIIGEMSLVGPRPRSVREAEFFESFVASDSENYNRVRPGLTGLWQISGRNSLDLQTKGRLDAYYADNWTLSSDFAIMFATVAVVLGGEGAY